ncbi:hypothetical protein ACFWXK_16955 [Streptomyces sp. NPDC059070]|uniref:hypothetical protein n=1 Tax=unclassified Streptomyces TaxID=2593676 RepID=UPI0034E21F6F
MSGQQEYFEALAAALRSGGMPRPEVSATVAELSGYLADSGGTDPYEEFGAPEVFAARLTGGRTDREPAAEAETWKWTADIYTDRKHLNHYGDQGWEVEGLDRLGRFVCRRDPAAAMRWEYRRESADTAAGREAVTAGLAPDGWEPCGQWMFFMYFKRPKAASAGPAAGLDELVAPPAKQLFLSGRYRGSLKKMTASGVASGTATALAIHFAGDEVAYWALAGAAVAVPAAVVLAWKRVKREVATGVEDPGPVPGTAA